MTKNKKQLIQEVKERLEAWADSARIEEIQATDTATIYKNSNAQINYRVLIEKLNHALKGGM